MTRTPPRLIALSRFVEDRGTLNALDLEEDVPFPVRRFFFIHDMQAGAVRGDHAHRQARQLILALSGEIDITVESGDGSSRYRLETPDRALYVPEMSWVTVRCISEGAVCLVFASHPYEEGEYIRDRGEFRAMIAG